MNTPGWVKRKLNSFSVVPTSKIFYHLNAIVVSLAVDSDEPENLPWSLGLVYLTSMFLKHLIESAQDGDVKLYLALYDSESIPKNILRAAMLTSYSILFTNEDFKIGLRYALGIDDRIENFSQLCSSAVGIKCTREEGIRFTITGSRIFISVLISNVAGKEDIVTVRVKGSRTGWLPMSRNWDQNWHVNALLQNQPLSFEVTSSDGITLT
ncbi:Expansin-A13 [Glycine soja]